MYFIFILYLLKIINNTYVDIGTLISKLSDPNDCNNNVSIQNCRLFLTPKVQAVTITDIQKWTDAFLIFSSIYTSAHPDCVAGIVKYIHTFQLKKEKNPDMPWNVVDQELWLVYMYSGNINTLQTPSSVLPNKCCDYKYKGICSKTSCPYLHVCIKCSQRHPHHEALKLKVKEVKFGRIAGPLLHKPFSNLRISPMGLVPKHDGF
ncbi:hypothetical protein KUTeg_016714 [Tegillarca granosa]|uniref:C3H1-type domain-containing protein n=1 Tax=Tegillarca granosa TaxID=220873 RepID=A0ABQ9ELL5_TEGGR|nr:hypothetical protein KUTeg_016714 [Tegillarca granosa]